MESSLRSELDIASAASKVRYSWLSKDAIRNLIRGRPIFGNGANGLT